jgi:hypothetical protein
MTTIAIVGFEIGTKRSRCGAPDHAPPALVGSGRGGEAPIHIAHIHA